MAREGSIEWFVTEWSDWRGFEPETEANWHPLSESFSYKVEKGISGIKLQRTKKGEDKHSEFLKETIESYQGIIKTMLAPGQYQLGGYFAGAHFSIDSVNNMARLTVNGSGVPVIISFRGPLLTAVSK